MSRIPSLLIRTVSNGALVAAVLAVTAISTYAQQNTGQRPAAEKISNNATAVAAATPAPNPPSKAAVAPVFTDYKGIRIGMNADEVRTKLGNLKEKSKVQDFFVFSDAESAQVYYDDQGKVMAVSVHYAGSKNSAPAATAVLGEDISPNQDGSMYSLKRYPGAGYWVAYSKTAGDSPIVTVTMQKM
jgi:hypothetical protein